MDAEIRQIKCSDIVAPFEPKFRKRWNVDSYNNPNEPAIFFGVYHQGDIDAINNHKGFKLIWNTQRVISNFGKINPDNAVVVWHPLYDCSHIANRYRVKKCHFQIKNFDHLKPSPLGDKLYSLMGLTVRHTEQRFDLANEISIRSGFKIYLAYYGLTDQQLLDAYDSSFLNLQLDKYHGGSTAVDLAYMGRRSLSNAYFPFAIPYYEHDMDNILKMIETESKKIGTIQPPCVGDIFDTGEEWKQVKFWDDAHTIG